jgi:hypothetical protein
MMDFLEEDAFRKQLARFRRSEELYPHRSQALFYTAGVKFLAECSRLSWLIDLIAAWQWRALRDPDLAIFQLWELGKDGAKTVVICLKDSETVAFCLPVPKHDVGLEYVSMYVELGVLMLPSEKSKALPEDR